MDDHQDAVVARQGHGLAAGSLREAGARLRAQLDAGRLVVGDRLLEPGAERQQDILDRGQAGHLPTSLPAAKANNAYSTTLSASVGTAPHTWKLASGALPKGLSLSASTGVISGTPSKAETSSFTIRVTDSSSPALNATQSYSLSVSP